MYKESRSEEGWAKKKAYTAEWWKTAPIQKRLLYAARRRSKINKLLFDIEESDIIIPDVCPILDVKLEVSYEKQASSSPSLDRVDSTKGYVKGNVRVISYKANACKSNMTIEQLKTLLSYMEN